MRHTRRFIFWVVAVSIGMAWTAVVVLWVRSYWRGDSIVRIGQPRSWLFLSGNGGACVAVSHDPNPSTLSVSVAPHESTDKPRYPQPGMWAGSIVMTNLRIDVPSSGTISTGGIVLAPLSPPAAPAATGTASIRMQSLTMSSQSSFGASSVSINGTLTIGTAPPVGPSVVVSSGTLVTPRTTIWGLKTGALPPPPNGALFGQTKLLAYRVVDPGGGAIPARTWVLIFPYWLAAVVVGLPLLGCTVIAYRARRKLARAQAGFCANCGYDLRATPDRCPECGSVAAASVLSS